jgi:hypothetical protein
VTVFQQLLIIDNFIEFRVCLCVWDNFSVFFLTNYLLISLQNNCYFVRLQLVSELQHFPETSSSSISMVGGRGQVPNEEAPHHDRNVQDVMIEDLQRQVAELAQCLAAQEVGNREMENSDSDSTFDNPYHNPSPYR